jgi:lauroyl/myristoyl acyltransferase
MRFLLDGSERAHEVPDLAYEFARHTILRQFVRWKVRAITSQELRGVEWITTERDVTRPMVISFVHHHQYEGIWASLTKQYGEKLIGIMLPEWMEPDAPIEYRQHRKLIEVAGELHPAGGAKFMMDNYLRPGDRFVISPDLAGNVPVTFLGKQFLCSPGASRMAFIKKAPVVCVTTHRSGKRHYVQFHPPLEPNDYANASELNQAMFDIHAPAILAWPEALDTPKQRFGAPEGASIQ